MKFGLNVAERLNLLQILPKEGNFITLKIVRNLQSMLSPSEEEIKEYELRQEGTSIFWNEKGREEKQLEFGETAKKVVSDTIKELDKNKKLTFQYITLYEKFIGLNGGNNNGEENN